MCLCTIYVYVQVMYIMQYLQYVCMYQGDLIYLSSYIMHYTICYVFVHYNMLYVVVHYMYSTGCE
jgi:hypothetical protein